MAGRVLKALVWLVVAGLIVGVAAVGWGYRSFNSPGPLASDTTVILARGEGVMAISSHLERAGVVSDAHVFAVGVRLHRAERGLRAGEYRFAARASMLDVMQQLVAGRTVVRRVTLAEGLTSQEAVAVIEAAEALNGTIDEVPSEGSLLPETYHYSYGDSRAAILARMRQSMQSTVSEAWARRSADLPLQSPEEAIVLASIVEKETAKPEERAHIAGVFINRLKRGMRLQSDPTVAYGLTEGRAPLDRALTRSDLKHPTPYNTYVIKGLPPGPICNPGKAAIEAVLQPMQTKDLYFVADGNGGHAFAETYAQHRRNVSRWRRLQSGSD